MTDLRTAAASLLLALPLAVVAAPPTAAGAPGTAGALPAAVSGGALPAAVPGGALPAVVSGGALPAALPAAVSGGALPGVADPDFTPLPEDEAPGSDQTGEAETSEPEDATGGTPMGAADQITFGIAPADAEGADGRTSFRLELDPGATHTDHVEVTNYSDQTVTFALLASDGVITSEGNFDLLPSDVAPVDTGAWIEIDSELELEPEGSAVVPFTLAVPDDAVPGDRPGGIVASLSSVGDDEAGNTVAFDTRAGARVHLRVAGEIDASLGFAGLEMDYRPSWNPFAPGTVDVSWDAVNDGNVRLGAEQTADVAGLLGIGGGTAQIDGPREILPDQSARHSVSVPAWPTFRLDGQVSLTPVVVGADDIPADLATSVASAQVWAVPWLHLAAVLLLALGAVLLVRRRRRRKAAFAAAIAAAREQGARSRDDDGGGDGDDGVPEPSGDAADRRPLTLRG